MMNTLKKFHIYNVKRLDNQVNEKDPVKHNVIFDHTVNIYTTLLLHPGGDVSWILSPE